MSVLNFPDELQVLVVDTSTELYLGSTVVSLNQEFGHVLLRMFKHGTHATTEQFRIGVYTNSDLSDTPFYSNTMSVSDITSLTSSDWVGRVRFDFDRQTMNSATTYYITLDPVSYTRNSDTFYFSVLQDWPLSVNTNNTPYAGAAMEFWGYR